MKSLGGLRRALESARPRNVSFHPSRAQLSFSAYRSFGNAARDQFYSTPRIRTGKAIKPISPPQHGLSQPMRAVMRQIPHPVVVITTLESTCNLAELGDSSDDRSPRPIPRAMTVSSFTSLSVDPVPRVTFNVTLPSLTHQALVRCGKFNAHILSGDDHGARVADLFTRGNRTPQEANGSDLGVLSGLEKLGVQVLGREKWLEEWKRATEYGLKAIATGKAGTATSDGTLPPPTTLPILQGQGIMHVFKCEYRHLEPPVDGDFDHHAIVIGEVMDLIPGDPKDESIALAYADRAYRQVGEKLLDRPVTGNTT
ncbi:flavin reductase like domain-containing protein [Hypomontagnella monticulosa]|nr:flavin reductase like domain-containing protein [Hypomontagnella monticulosa]